MAVSAVDSRGRFALPEFESSARFGLYRVHDRQLRIAHRVPAPVPGLPLEKQDQGIQNVVENVITKAPAVKLEPIVTQSLAEELAAFELVSSRKLPTGSDEDKKKNEADRKKLTDFKNLVVANANKSLQGKEPANLRELTAEQSAARKTLGQLLFLMELNPQEAAKTIYYGTEANVAKDIGYVFSKFKAKLDEMRMAFNAEVEKEAKLGITSDILLRQGLLPKEIAKIVVTPDGFINQSIIHDVTNAFLGTEHLPYQGYMRNVLADLEKKEVRYQLLNQVKAPADKACQSIALIRALNELAPDAEVTDVHAKRAALSAHLTLLQQANIGNCYANSVGKLLQKLRVDKFGQDLNDLLANGRLVRSVEGQPQPAEFVLNGNNTSLQLEISISKTGLMQEGTGKGIFIGESKGFKLAASAMGVAQNAYADLMKNAIAIIAASHEKKDTFKVTAQAVILAMGQANAEMQVKAEITKRITEQVHADKEKVKPEQVSSEIAKRLAEPQVKEEIAKRVADMAPAIAAKAQLGYFGFTSLRENVLLRAWENVLAAMAEFRPHMLVRGGILQAVASALHRQFKARNVFEADALERIFKDFIARLNKSLVIEYNPNTSLGKPSVAATDGKSNSDGAFVLKGVTGPKEFSQLVADSWKATADSAQADMKAALERNVSKDGSKSRFERINKYVFSDTFLNLAIKGFDPENAKLKHPVANYEKVEFLPWRARYGDDPFQLLRTYFGESQVVKKFTVPNSGQLFVELIEVGREMKREEQEEIPAKTIIVSPQHAFELTPKNFAQFIASEDAPVDMVNDYMKKAVAAWNDRPISEAHMDKIIAWAAKRLVDPKLYQELGGASEVVFQELNEIKQVENLTYASFRAELLYTLEHNLAKNLDAKAKALSIRLLDKFIMNRILPEVLTEKLSPYVVRIANTNWEDEKTAEKFDFCFFPNPLSQQVHFGRVEVEEKEVDGQKTVTLKNLVAMNEDQWITNKEWDVCKTDIRTEV